MSTYTTFRIWLKRAATLVGFVMLLVGFAAIVWPFPLFTLNQPYLDWYLANVLGMPTDDPSAGAGLPMFWFFISMPFGVLWTALSIPLLYWGRKS